MVDQLNGQDQETLNREERIQLGIHTAKELKNRPGARVIFESVLAEDPRNERALMWMAYLSQSKAERQQYLRKVLKVNPRNQRAKQQLEKMATKRQARTNRTLIYGALIIAVAVMVVVAVALVLILVAQ